MKKFIIIVLLLISGISFGQVRARQVKVNATAAGIVSTNAQAAFGELKTLTDLAVKINSASQYQKIKLAVGDNLDEAAIIADTPIDGMTIMIPTNLTASSDGYVQQAILSLDAGKLKATFVMNGMNDVVSNELTLPSGGGGVTELFDDKSPVLGGNLDGSYFTITNIHSINVSNSITAIDAAFEVVRFIPNDTSQTDIEGNIYADNSEDRLKYYDGTSWKAILLEGDAVTQTTGTFTPTLIGTTGGSHTLFPVGSYPLGYYIKTGKKVDWWVRGTIGSKNGTPTGNLAVKLNIAGITPKSNMSFSVVIGAAAFHSSSPAYIRISAIHSTFLDQIDFHYKNTASTGVGTPYPVPTSSGGSITISGSFITN